MLRLPDYPDMKNTWHPIPGNIMTCWAAEVTPENVWQEYPRPQLCRPEWQNLNGLWDYWITNRTDKTRRIRAGEILVPFPIESALSGVKQSLDPGELLWYRRTFSIPAAWQGKRVLLHFGAVDWQSTIFINDQPIGTHTGGFLPFCFDITDFLTSNGLQNELLVSVWDPTDTQWQQRGKQVLKPKSIWYTPVSGIWQTVWLEPVPQAYITGLKITPDIDKGTARVEVNFNGTITGSTKVNLTVYDAGICVATGEIDSVDHVITVQIPNPKLWSPTSPNLYDLEITAGEDRVTSYFGMRKFSVKDGHLCLNNRPLFQYGPLDQGYWPDGLYTPPSDQAMKSDIDLVKRLGFNMLRKHVKVEPARYYYYCDQIGLIVWQDMPNGGNAVSELTSTLAIAFGTRRRDSNYHYAGREQAASRQDFQRELQEMVDHLYNFTCIGMWVQFNEGWGQFDSDKTARWLKQYDPSRPVDHASGWFDQGGGDCKSLHVYKLKLPWLKSDGKRAVVLSEFGGYGLRVDGHQWNPVAQFGYKTFATSKALSDAYIDLLLAQLKPWVDGGLSAAIYTQSTDVEIEVNGFVTYDREVEKMDFTRIEQVHKLLLG
jgi:beta-galactosidase/beta-glucuronidase